MDGNDIEGSLDGNVCLLSQISLSIVTADCDSMDVVGSEEISCSCCSTCCIDDGTASWISSSCHNYALDHSDVDWDTGYERDYYTFDQSDTRYSVLSGNLF